MNVVRPKEVGLSPTGLDRIRPAIEEYVDRYQLPGAITLVARRGKVAHLETYGMMDLEAGKAMQPDTILRVYSFTKPVTCAGLMVLYDEGRFSLDDPVSRYIPEFGDLDVCVRSTERGLELERLEREITVRHLLTHTAGLGYGLLDDSPVEDLYRAERIFSPMWVLQMPLEEMVQRVAELPLASQPGADWRYSIAHDVIGYLVEVLSSVPFDVFLQERIFGPLGMVDTGFWVPPDKIDRFAAMYGAVEGGLGLLDAPASSPFAEPHPYPSGGGGLVSTTSDYLRFAQMLLNGGELHGVRVLRRETVAQMTRNQLPSALVPIHLGPNAWPDTGYGLGLGVRMGRQSGGPRSEGNFFWPGISGVRFWADPRQELIGLCMRQVLFGGQVIPELGQVPERFQNLVYQALID